MSPAPLRPPAPTATDGSPIADNLNAIFPQYAAAVRAGLDERVVAFSASS